MGCHQLTGNGQRAAAGYRANEHQRRGLRRDAQQLEKWSAEPGEQFHGTGGPKHTHGGEQGYQRRNNVQQHGQTLLGAMGQGGIDIDAPPGAVSSPTVTEAMELTQTAGRMSKGAALP